MLHRWWLALLFVGHAVIHVLAFQAAWGIGSIEEFSPVPAFPVTTAGSDVTHILGTLWIVAAVAFLATATLVVQSNRWWRPAATAASLISLVVCVLWWHDAPAGAAVDLLILSGLTLGGLLHSRLVHPRLSVQVR